MSSGLSFICYSRIDLVFTQRLATHLHSRGLNVWMDKIDIPKGAAWDREIEKALIKADTVIVILSPAAVESENVFNEIDYAIRKNKRIIPVIIQECELPLRISRLQQVSFLFSFEEGAAELVEALGGVDEPVYNIPLKNSDQTLTEDGGMKPFRFGGSPGFFKLSRVGWILISVVSIAILSTISIYVFRSKKNTYNNYPLTNAENNIVKEDPIKPDSVKNKDKIIASKKDMTSEMLDTVNRTNKIADSVQLHLRSNAFYPSGMKNLLWTLSRYLRYHMGTETDSVEANISYNFELDTKGVVNDAHVNVFPKIDWTTNEAFIGALIASGDWKPAILNGLQTKANVNLIVSCSLFYPNLSSKEPHFKLVKLSFK